MSRVISLNIIYQRSIC